MKTLIVVDVQNDFMPGGNLAVPFGDEIVPLINEIQNKFDYIVATQDWHPENHKSFASQHKGKKVFDIINLNGISQTLWPNHCVQGSKGAEFHKDLKTQKIETIVRKGMNPEVDSYSAFYDNHQQKSTGLAGMLKEKGVKEVYVCGLAADYCVYFTIKDALSNGFKACLIEDATKAISQEDFKHKKDELLKNKNFSLY